MARHRLSGALVAVLAGTVVCSPAVYAADSAGDILSPQLATDAQISAVLAQRQQSMAERSTVTAGTPPAAQTMTPDAAHEAPRGASSQRMAKPDLAAVAAVPAASHAHAESGSTPEVAAVLAPVRLVPVAVQAPTLTIGASPQPRLAPVRAASVSIDAAELLQPELPVPAPLVRQAADKSLADIASNKSHAANPQQLTALQGSDDAADAVADVSLNPITIDGGVAAEPAPDAGSEASSTAAMSVILPNSFAAPAATPVPPPVPPASLLPPGLMVGTGGLTGSVGGALNPTLFSLLGAGSDPNSAVLTAGRMNLAASNVTQSYSVTSIALLGNLLTLNPVTNGANATLTGSDQNLTLLGGVTSDNYITGINYGTAGAGTAHQTGPGGILGLLLPNGAPAWSANCGDLLGLGLVTSQCWSINAAQNNQVLIGDNAMANGSEEVVIGTGATHKLAPVAADSLFPGEGGAGQTGTEGVPDADYQARLGHSVVIGDSASGTQNAQTLLGADATSNQPNSVALGYDSFANRGPVAGYTAFGLTGTQTSGGEVSVGNDGSANPLDINNAEDAAPFTRQITNVAPGSAATDAVNVEQLQGAVTGAVTTADKLSVKYDADTGGNPTNMVSLVGDGTGAKVGITNLAAGALGAASTDAVNGSQLFATNTAVASYFGGTTAFDGTTNTWTAPDFSISNIDAGGNVTTGSYDNVTDAFSALDASLDNVNTNVTNNTADLKYFQANSTAAAAAASGSEAVAVGGAAVASRTNSVAIGNGADASEANSVALGAGSATTVGALTNYTAFGLTALQTSTGEVNVGNRQITGVAAGSSATDAVNVEQLQGAVTGAVGTADKLSVKYDADAGGNPTNTVSLVGDGSGAQVGITNLAAGALGAASTDAVNGSQLFATNTTVAKYFGGTTAFDATTNTWTAPDFSISNIDVSGNVTTGSYDNVTDAFSALDTSLDNVNTNVTNNTADLKYFQANSTAAAAAASGSEAVAIGGAAVASQINSVAIGNGADASEADSVALGAGSATTVGALTNYTAFGLAALQSSAGEVNVGNRQITGVAAGNAATDAVNVAQLQGAVAGAVGSADKLSVKYDADTGGNATNTVTLVGDGSGAQVGITNLAGGALSATSTDAVNGSQLFNTNTTIAQYFGGATAFDGAANTWVPPNFSITNVDASGNATTGSYNNVTSAFAALDASLNNVNNRIGSGGGGGGGDFAVNDTNGLGSPTASGTNSAAGGAGTVAAGADSTAVGNGAQANGTDSVALGAGSVATRDNVVSVGSAGHARQVINVADGTAATDAVNVEQLDASQTGTVRYDTSNDDTVNYNSITLGNPAGGGGPTVVHNVGAGAAATDAVNVAQLQGVQNWAKQYTDAKFDGLSGQINNLGNRAYAGIAGAMAMAGLPQAYLPGKSMASVAASSFHGESSVAVGISMISDNGRWVYKLSGTDNSRGDAGVTIGAGIQW